MIDAALFDEFRLEAAEHLSLLDARMLELERTPADLQPLRELFRSAHTLKGGGALLGLTEVVELVHALEDVLGSVRDGHARVERATVDVLFRAIDALRDLSTHAQFGSPHRIAGDAGIVAALRAEALRLASPRHASESPTDLTRRRILIVDASATVRRLTTMLLTDAGFNVVAVADGRQALASAQATHYDLVITSIETAGLDGFELVAALRGVPAYTELPVIMTTGGDVEKYRERGAECGVRAVLSKGSLRNAQLVETATALLPPQSKPLRILLVDDSRLNQIVGMNLLRVLGYRAHAVDDGASALRALVDGDYAAVLMDCQLAGMDGLQAAREIRLGEAPGRHIPIIATTADSHAEDRAQCLAAGMDDFLTKPVQRADLEACLTRWTQAPAPVDLESLDGLRALVQPGQPDPITPLINLFVHESRGRLADCAAALESGDSSALAVAAHALKGNMGTFGAPTMYRLASDLERSARAPSPDDARGIVGALDHEFPRVVQALEQFLSEIRLGVTRAR